MLMTRYEHAARLAAGKDVLEVACGSGQGLGYLAGRARRVVGGDRTRSLLGAARSHYDDRIPLIQLDAQQLPFRDGSFDVVILHEAIYYLSSPRQFVSECERLLREAGTVIIFTVNREWPDFNPSPFSQAYPAATDLYGLLRGSFRRVQLYGAFPARPKTALERGVSFLKRSAVRFRLIPGTMKGKR